MINFVYWMATVFAVYIVLVNLSLIKLSIKEILLMISSTQLISVIFIDKEFLSMLIAIVFIIGIVYIKTKNIFLSILLPIFSLLLTIVNDYIISSFETYIFKMNPSHIRFNLTLYLIHCIFLFILNFSLSKFIKYFISNKLKLNNLFFKGKLGLVLTISLILTLTIFYINIILGDIDGVSNNIIFINGVMFFIYFILLLIIMYILIKSVINELEITTKHKELKNLQEYTLNLEELYMDMRKFRHDYINIISSMLGYMDNNDMDGLRNHFNKNIIPLSNQFNLNTFKLGLLKNIKIPEIKGLLSSKVIRAQELGIDVTIDILEPITTINMNIIDCCRSIGILLDNAVEAAISCENPSLKIGFITKKNSLIIVIVNSCPKDIPSIYQIFKKGFSTKGENRGLGLNNLKEILQNYNHISLDTSLKNQEFIQLIEIYNK